MIFGTKKLLSLLSLLSLETYRHLVGEGVENRREMREGLRGYGLKVIKYKYIYIYLYILVTYKLKLLSQVVRPKVAKSGQKPGQDNLVDSEPVFAYSKHVAPHWAAGTGILKTERTSAQSKRFFVASVFYGGCYGGSSERRSSVLSCQPCDIRHPLISSGSVAAPHSGQEPHHV